VRGLFHIRPFMEVFFRRKQTEGPRYSSDLFHRLIAMGLKASLNGEHEKAAPHFEQALRFCPGDNNLTTAIEGLLFSSYAALHDTNSMAKLLRAKIIREPKNRYFHCELGLVLNRQSKFVEAETVLRKAIKLGDRDCFDVHLELATSLLHQGRIAAGMDSIYTAMRLKVPPQAKEDLLRLIEYVVKKNDGS